MVYPFWLDRVQFNHSLGSLRNRSRQGSLLQCDTFIIVDPTETRRGRFFSFAFAQLCSAALKQIRWIIAISRSTLALRPKMKFSWLRGGPSRIGRSMGRPSDPNRGFWQWKRPGRFPMRFKTFIRNSPTRRRRPVSLAKEGTTAS
jgi:hypothetical protein